MAAQDTIDRAEELLAISDRDLTAEEVAEVSRGMELGRLLVAMDEFKAFLDAYPQSALDLVNDFKASPQFATLEALMA